METSARVARHAELENRAYAWAVITTPVSPRIICEELRQTVVDAGFAWDDKAERWTMSNGKAHEMCN